MTFQYFFKLVEMSRILSREDLEKYTEKEILAISGIDPRLFVN
ncbi:hypothetical protein STRMA_1207 [Streptococcus macacae NCTC 11558]|uniref:Uncharacterized protein n=1 Tax=Streptococcus macacae NCTC 11558 TaxID=764298 RepID=G5JWS1_9STRE|nr:hypothetical protein STRMA_1207 [Streptococcus macacae NCTC 11558]